MILTNVKKKLINKKKKKFFFGNLFIKANYKNTIISLTKLNGNLLKQWSAKGLNKTKSKKNTPTNLILLSDIINKYLTFNKIKKLNIYLNGLGYGRSYILSKINKKQIQIRFIFDKTSISFNGCRKKKKKRR